MNVQVIGVVSLIIFLMSRAQQGARQFLQNFIIGAPFPHFDSITPEFTTIILDLPVDNLNPVDIPLDSISGKLLLDGDQIATFSQVYQEILKAGSTSIVKIRGSIDNLQAGSEIIDAIRSLSLPESLELHAVIVLKGFSIPIVRKIVFQ